MTETQNPLPVSILKLVVLTIIRSFIGLLIEFQQLYVKSVWLLQTNTDSDEPFRTEVECKSSGKHEGLLKEEDIDVVLKKLGMLMSCCSVADSGSRYGEKCRHCELLEGTKLFLEEKEASLEELGEAFAVFDENGEGYIDSRKLQKVLGRLEFKEGMKLEDCQKMISAFDVNGDGRIDFYEFRKMFENVI